MNKTLVVLAAGMGSRYGGLKQVEEFGPSGEFIMDYSIYDAIKVGFNKIVFIIREEHLDIFRNTIGNRIKDKVDVEYVFQNFDNVPAKYDLSKRNGKPLGTGQAILCAKKAIDGNFLIINSDDFYGYDSFNKASIFINDNKDGIGIVSYKLVNTMTDNGSVKRGLLKVDDDNNIKEIDECLITKNKNTLEAISLLNKNSKYVDSDSKVSMNMIVFPKTFMKYIESKYKEFLKDFDVEKDEFLIPSVLNDYIKEGNHIKNIDSDEVWVGVTYKDDKDKVKKHLNNLVKNNKYPNNLWN